MPRLRFRPVLGIVGPNAIHRMWPVKNDRSTIDSIVYELTPKKASHGNSGRKDLRQIRKELLGSLDRFNRRWSKFVDELDLTQLNKIRVDYNQYDVLEKECAGVSPAAARHGFEELPEVKTANVFEIFPLIPQILLE